jgi:ABC-type Mn2+/Zn2+ transport system permease subunit
MTVGTLFCWAAFVAILFNVNPYSASTLEFIFFFSSFALAVIGTCSVVGFLLRRVFLKDDEIIFRHVKHTFRQAILVAIVLTLLLILQAMRLLTWWNLPLPILFAIFLETIVFTKRKFSNTPPYGS